ncbi:MAG: creatininase family protein [candidate division Zixibacteria bacterium]|nr:creatininase family protein [candidate division Zixibacteria bacterium]
MEREIQRLNWLKIKELVPDKVDTVILPVGTMEAHGSSCVGTDNFIPEDIASSIAERVDALIAPIVYYGITKSLYHYNGGMTIKPENFSAYIQDILLSLVKIGFKNIIVMNGHGGNNSTLKSLAFEFHKDRSVNIAVVHWWELCAKMTEEFFGHVGGHAGTDETAMVMAIDPALVDEHTYDPEMAYNFVPGADIYPVPGTILLYKKGEGYPEFDLDKSRQYREQVMKYVGEFVESIIARWRKFGL